jgi:hypothetical protein
MTNRTEGGSPMPRKRTAIILDQLARESAVELDSMVVELIGETLLKAGDGTKPTHWRRRFAASGKFTLIRPFGKP